MNELFVPDYVCHLASDPDPVRGHDKVKQMNVGFRWTFDIYPTDEPDLLIAEGDLIRDCQYRSRFRTTRLGNTLFPNLC